MVHQNALPIHLVLLEHSHVALHEFVVLKLAKSIVLTVSELTDVLDSAGSELTKSMELTVPKLTLENALLTGEVKNALPRGFSIFPLAFVSVTRQKVVHLTVSIRLVLLEVSNKRVTITECILSKAFFDVVLPVAFVCFSIRGYKHANSVLLVIEQFAFIAIASIFVHHLVVWALNDVFLHALKDGSKVLLHQLGVTSH